MEMGLHFTMRIKALNCGHTGHGMEIVSGISTVMSGPGQKKPEKK